MKPVYSFKMVLQGMEMPLASVLRFHLISSVCPLENAIFAKTLVVGMKDVM